MQASGRLLWWPTLEATVPNCHSRFECRARRRFSSGPVLFLFFSFWFLWLFLLLIIIMTMFSGPAVGHANKTPVPNRNENVRTAAGHQYNNNNNVSSSSKNTQVIKSEALDLYKCICKLFNVSLCNWLHVCALRVCASVLVCLCVVGVGAAPPQLRLPLPHATCNLHLN